MAVSRPAVSIVRGRRLRREGKLILRKQRIRRQRRK